VHPIGRTFRKGPNNTLDPGPHDVGSPWAIGSAEGGHDAIHPDLGTFADFDAFVAHATDLGLEVAIDFALQASPDHPWVTSHPDWFSHRADGSIAYAENPPKKYQDIYPINFDDEFDGMVAESLRLLRLWMSHGVRIFRVDNPHTKPVVFWETVFGELARTDPDVVFLSEAFTRPAMMLELAKVGFSQSYTYFTWRTTKTEVEEYLREVTSETSHLLRPNFFVNTPDILPAFLQTGGPAAFAIRAVLAATAVPSWGMYSGFELFESAALRPGGEEYLDSEKFQLRPREFELAESEGRSLVPLVTALNRIRHEHPALQRLRGLVIHDCPDPAIVVYSRTVGDDTVLTVLTLDPRAVRETLLGLDMEALGMVPGQWFRVRDELSGEIYSWSETPFVRLDPSVRVGHVLTVLR
jgi:starch synthase (maltosyl-transferring)